jgi:hypothetical protein
MKLFIFCVVLASLYLAEASDFPKEDLDFIVLETRRFLLMKKTSLQGKIREYKRSIRQIQDTYDSSDKNAWPEIFENDHKKTVDSAIVAGNVCFNLFKEFDACSVGAVWGAKFDPRFEDIDRDYEGERI